MGIGMKAAPLLHSAPATTSLLPVSGSTGGSLLEWEEHKPLWHQPGGTRADAFAVLPCLEKGIVLT